MIFTFVAFCLFGSALAGGPYVCSNVETVNNLDIARYTGLWYQARIYCCPPYDNNAKCITDRYTLGANGTLKVNSGLVSLVVENPSCSCAEGILRVPDASEPGKLKIKLTFMPPGIEAPYWILGTDYDSYTVVYDCEDLLFNEFTRIFTRDRNPSDEVIAKAVAVIEKNNICTCNYYVTNQKDC